MSRKCFRRSLLVLALVAAICTTAEAGIDLPNEAVNLKALGHWPNGACYGACVVGNSVVAGNGAALGVIYFGDAADPVRVGRVVLPSEVYVVEMA
ncbi:hypothetical protein H8E07_03385, partial [bacterium]|nr:hypothetical protein [bacterium]